MMKCTKNVYKMYLMELPDYLQSAIDNYERCYEDCPDMVDCYYDELDASIDTAECNGEISSNHANFLRYNILNSCYKSNTGANIN